MRLSVSGEDSLRCPFTDSLTAHTQLGGKRLLRKPGSLAAINEPLRHRKIHGSSFHVVTVIE